MREHGVGVGMASPAGGWERPAHRLAIFQVRGESGVIHVRTELKRISCFPLLVSTSFRRRPNVGTLERGNVRTAPRLRFLYPEFAGEHRFGNARGEDGCTASLSEWSLYPIYVSDERARRTGGTGPVS